MVVLHVTRREQGDHEGWALSLRQRDDGASSSSSNLEIAMIGLTWIYGFVSPHITVNIYETCACTDTSDREDAWQHRHRLSTRTTISQWRFVNKYLHQITNFISGSDQAALQMGPIPGS
jgi:hypothetical protein